MSKFFHDEIKMMTDANDSNKENVYIYGEHVFGPASVSECVDYVARYLKMGDYGDSKN